MFILDSFLKFENDPKLLSFSFVHDNILIWPFARYTLLKYIFNKEFNSEKVHTNINNLSLINIIKYICQSIKLSPFGIKNNYDIISFSTYLLSSEKKDGKYFNRIADYFGSVYPKKTLILERSSGMKYRLPRYFNNIASPDIIAIRAAIKSKFSRSKSQDACEIKNFLGYLQKHLPVNIDNTINKKIEKSLLIISKKLPILHRFYKKLLKKLRPKIIFLNCASYGYESYIIKWAKEMEIITGEYQHGILGMPYKYGTILQKSKEYEKYIPEYLITFGEYWNDQAQTNSKTIAIGNPHFEEKLKSFTPEQIFENSAKHILMVSQGTTDNKMVDLTIKLSNLVKERKYNIIYKLHPGESSFQDRYKKLYNIANIQVADSGDIYKYIYKSNFIITISSFTIFEAIAFNKYVFVYNLPEANLFIPKDFGCWFNSAEELYELIEQKNPFKTIRDRSYYWQNDWRDNYINFIEQILNN